MEMFNSKTSNYNYKWPFSIAKRRKWPAKAIVHVAKCRSHYQMVSPSQGHHAWTPSAWPAVWPRCQEWLLSVYLVAQGPVAGAIFPLQTPLTLHHPEATLHKDGEKDGEKDGRGVGTVKLRIRIWHKVLYAPMIFHSYAMNVPLGSQYDPTQWLIHDWFMVWNMFFFFMHWE